MPKREPLVIAMVGLPARGKSYTARKLARYLHWLGYNTRIFNVGRYRRELQKDQPVIDGGTTGSKEEKRQSDLFDPTNETGNKLRAEAAKLAMQDMLNWLASNGNNDNLLAIYDATNTTRERRAWIRGACKEKSVLFVEMICDDLALIDAGIRDVKVECPEYASVADEASAVTDFKRRIDHYNSVYEPVNMDEQFSCVKCINLGEQFKMDRLDARHARIAYFLVNTAKGVHRKMLWLTRHGESTNNVAGQIGGDADLSVHGFEFAHKLAEFAKERNIRIVWTSTLRRTRQTAQFIDADAIVEWRALDELHAGACDGMTYAEIGSIYPEHLARRDADKYRYRYPEGESYADLVWRLEPVLMELERQSSDLLVVGHQAVLRCLLAYFGDVPCVEMPLLEVPLHEIIGINVNAYTNGIERVCIDVPAVSTHRVPLAKRH